jgi:hypothetical protein
MPSLCFRHIRLEDDELIECLRYMPSLVHLTPNLDSGAGITHKILARLTLPHQLLLDELANYLVPKLEYMYLFMVHEISGAAFASMVESRRRSSNAMQSGDIQQVHMFTELDARQIHLGDNGQEVEVAL